MRYFFFFFALLFCTQLSAQDKYVPTPENLKAREAFRDDKFGMFIHWGASSVLGDGEWVMNNRKIRVHEYKNLINYFNPQDFDAKTWVSLAKKAGMKYIIFVSRHHDSFSNWDTEQSEWKITNTPYGKDAMKMLADECARQNMKLGFYYSTLDWFRDDYPYETGRTGQGSGRTVKSNYDSYLKFMKAQLTELLTNYGKVSAIWFDGHWDQTNLEGHEDRSSRLDWRYDEIYSLIHRLQPQCLIGNNHHLDPIAGEDFQMFERDLPGENKSGYSYQAASSLPLETCETLSKSWGYSLTDTLYKTPEQVIHYLVGAAGRNANLLLNIGPMPDGRVQPEFTSTLEEVGKWTSKYGETIYGTRGNVITPQQWGVATKKGNKIYLHILNAPEEGKLEISLPQKIKSAVNFDSRTPVRFTSKNNITSVTLPQTLTEINHIIELTY